MTDQKRFRGGRLLVVILVTAAVLIAAAVVVQRIRAAREKREVRVVAELYYISIAPPDSPPQLRESAQISSMRLHFFVRNPGTTPLEFAPRDRVQLFERVDGRAGLARSDVAVSLPRSIAPAQMAEVVIEKPYTAEYVSPDAWKALYPEREPQAAAPTGRFIRLALPVPLAHDVMERRRLTPEQLLAQYDVVGEGPARECTALARAMLRRKWPRLSGFELRDPENAITVEFPLPPS